ncbi:MAG: Ig-like domain-containing protein, partial [Planctomycetaceae bacterium]|nr:Ig-like domain-containing protein [Planctomycetaceae bacterium]
QPVSRGIANVTVNEDAAPTVISLFAAFDDNETPDNRLKFSVVSNTTPNLVATAIHPLTGQLTLTYRLNQSGVAQLVVRCTDTGGQAAQASFRVTVNPIADPPQLLPIPAQTAKANIVLSLVAKGIDPDLPNDLLRYSLDAASLGRGMTINFSTGAITWTPSQAFVGQTVSTTVTVQDRTNRSASQTFQIQVQSNVVIPPPPPPPPTPIPPLIAVNDRTTIAIGQSVNLTNLMKLNDMTNGRSVRIVQVRFPFYVNPAEILQTSTTTATGVGLTYTNRGYTGTQVISYTLQDDLGRTDSAWLTIQSGGYVPISLPPTPNPAVVNISMPNNTPAGRVIGFVSAPDPDGGGPRYREADPNLFPELKTHPKDAVVFNSLPAGTIQPADGLTPFAINSSSGAITYLGGVTLATGQIFVRNYLVYDGRTGSPTSNHFNPNFGKIVIRVVDPPP